LRTSPAPMFLLSKLVQDHNFKVVLTGEGADEFLAGYDIFKEMKIRRFWAREPESEIRPLLLQKLYPDIPALNTGDGAFLTAFFKQRLTEVNAPLYSHSLRWHNTSRIKCFFSDALRADIQAAGCRFQPGELPSDTNNLPPGFNRWHPLHQAQYLEVTIFLSEYLLSSQGDRVGMAHSVEGRFPFLDYRLVEFANCLPPHYKLRGLTEKYLLKKLGSEWLPAEIWQRVKRPYRAPIHRSFFNEQMAPYVHEVLSPDYVARVGLFNPAAVSQLVKKIEHNRLISETDDMALAGILSSHLLFQQFVASFRMPAPLSEADDVKICFGPHALEGV
jgi:asparagine synthase (glutamine-hydrolysing)